MENPLLSNAFLNLNNMDRIERLKTGLGVYIIISLFIPTLVTVIFIFASILGAEMIINFDNYFDKVWVNYYYDGKLEEIMAFRAHLVLLLLCVGFFQIIE